MDLRLVSKDTDLTSEGNLRKRLQIANQLRRDTPRTRDFTGCNVSYQPMQGSFLPQLPEATFGLQLDYQKDHSERRESTIPDLLCHYPRPAAWFDQIAACRPISMGLSGFFGGSREPRNGL